MEGRCCPAVSTTHKAVVTHAHIHNHTSRRNQKYGLVSSQPGGAANPRLADSPTLTSSPPRSLAPSPNPPSSSEHLAFIKFQLQPRALGSPLSVAVVLQEGGRPNAIPIIIDGTNRSVVVHVSTMVPK
jgi:hypothetical protein